MEGNKKLVPILRGVIQVKFYFYEILSKIQTKEEKLKFLKTLKKIFRFQENFDFRGLCVSSLKSKKLFEKGLEGLGALKVLLDSLMA